MMFKRNGVEAKFHDDPRQAIPGGFVVLEPESGVDGVWQVWTTSNEAQTTVPDELAIELWSIEP